MDLRIFKTKRQIKDAFLKLRRQYMPERIKVKDICSLAMINKTTFYKHYVDSYELSEEIDDNSVESVIEKFPEKTNFFKSPKAYVECLARALECEAENLRIVYRGRIDVFCAKLEDKLKKFYDGAEQTAEKKYTLSFFIKGFVGILGERLFISEDEKKDKKAFSEYINKLVENVTQDGLLHGNKNT